MTGVDSGRMIRQKVWNLLAPSTAAASSELAWDRVDVALHVPYRERQLAGRDGERHAGDRVAQVELPNWILLMIRTAARSSRRRSITPPGSRSSGTRGR